MAEGKDKFDINNDQKLKQDNLDKSDGPIAKTEILKGHEGHDHEHDPIAKTEILDGQPEHGIHETETRADADFSPTPIHDTEDRADADFRPGNENFDINNDQKIAFDKSDGPGPDGVSGEVVNMADTEQDILAQANGAPNVSGDVVNMADMHSHMDDAAEHQVPEGPPQNPQGMGLDRLGTQFDEDGMGDMHKPDDPNDGGEVV
tara:strand:+ start:206 stop:817 length:612 start_codon:yes stop_codon:yes gene_type:complete